MFISINSTNVNKIDLQTNEKAIIFIFFFKMEG